MLLLIVAFTFSSVLSASTAPTNADTDAIKFEIAKLLKHPKFVIEGDATFEVTFRVNKNNELVVLDVDSESKVISDYIKSRLNYQKILVSPLDKNKNYSVCIRLSPSK